MATGNKRILVVDDDPDIVESLKIVLENADFDVDTATTVSDGLAQVESKQPDLILLDIMMPHGTEGFHFVWKLRSQYPHPQHGQWQWCRAGGRGRRVPGLGAGAQRRRSGPG